MWPDSATRDEGSFNRCSSEVWNIWDPPTPCAHPDVPKASRSFFPEPTRDTDRDRMSPTERFELSLRGVLEGSESVGKSWPDSRIRNSRAPLLMEMDRADSDRPRGLSAEQTTAVKGLIDLQCAQLKRDLGDLKFTVAELRSHVTAARAVDSLAILSSLQSRLNLVDTQVSSLSCRWHESRSSLEVTFAKEIEGIDKRLNERLEVLRSWVSNTIESTEMALRAEIQAVSKLDVWNAVEEGRRGWVTEIRRIFDELNKGVTESVPSAHQPHANRPTLLRHEGGGEVVSLCSPFSPQRRQGVASGIEDAGFPGHSGSSVSGS